MIKFIVSKRIVPAFLAIVAACSFSMVSCFACDPWNIESSSEDEIPCAPYIEGRDVIPDDVAQDQNQNASEDEALPPEGDESEAVLDDDYETISTPAEPY